MDNVLQTGQVLNDIAQKQAQAKNATKPCLFCLKKNSYFTMFLTCNSYQKNNDDYTCRGIIVPEGMSQKEVLTNFRELLGSPEREIIELTIPTSSIVYIHNITYKTNAK
jgi:hypothetical protein